jgi:prolyl-tRNA synthetase
MCALFKITRQGRQRCQDQLPEPKLISPGQRGVYPACGKRIVFLPLPLGIRILEKLKAVLRRALEELGGQEVLVPFLAPQSLFHSSGRLAWIGKEAKSIRTNDGQNLLLSPTHEESMVDLVRRVPHGFKELPLLIYQFQTKFRDEENPWGGLFRTKEFLMNDAYSFHRSFTGHQQFFPQDV